MSNFQGGFRNPIIHGNTIIDGTISGSALEDGAVIESKLADLAVAAGKLQDEAVAEAKLGDKAVTTVKLDDLAVTTAKIGLLAVGSAQISDISADKITAGTINTGTIDIESQLTVGSSGVLQVDGDGGQHTTIQYFGGFGGIQFWGTGSDDPGYIHAINSEELQIAAPVDDDTTHDFAMVRLNSENALGFVAGFSVSREGASGHNRWIDIDDDGITFDVPLLMSGGLKLAPRLSTRFSFSESGSIGFEIDSGQGAVFAADGSVSIPGYSFLNENDVGMWRNTSHGSGQRTISFSINGGEALAIAKPSGGITRLYGAEFNDWIEWDGVNEIFQFYQGNTETVRFGNGGTHGIQFPGRNTTTNSGLAAWRNDGFPGSKLLALSSTEAMKDGIRDITPQKARHYMRMYRPREWKSKASHDPKNVWLPGFVAEEMPKVPRDLTPALATLVTEHEKTIADLEQRLAKLERTAKVGAS